MKALLHVTLVIGLVGALSGAPRVSAQDRSVERLRQWSRGVMNHQPGSPDSALVIAWQLSAEDRTAILKDLAGFLDKINSPKQVRGASVYDVTNPIAAQMTASDFVERAAMFHSDAVIFDPRPSSAPQRASNSERVRRNSDPRSRTGMGGSGPQQATVTTSSDGEATGAFVINPNWQFGRDLLDQVVHTPAAQIFVPLWYHATAAYMLSHGGLGEVAPHLEHGSEIEPNDARILFDRACVMEALAMSPIQELRADADRSSALGGPSNLAVPSPSVANARAMDLYRNVLAVDPLFVEAHVRLARLLELAGRNGDADTEVTRALALDPQPDVAYLAHLFGARAADRLGKPDAAEAHLQAALGLFPKATSAMVAASQTALHRADIGAALDHLAGLASVNPVTDGDPWRVYLYGPGRNAKLALDELWAIAPRAKVPRIGFARSRPSPRS
jgi:hypothetical protein